MCEWVSIVLKNQMIKYLSVLLSASIVPLMRTHCYIERQIEDFWWSSVWGENLDGCRLSDNLSYKASNPSFFYTSLYSFSLGVMFGYRAYAAVWHDLWQLSLFFLVNKTYAHLVLHDIRWGGGGNVTSWM